MKASDEVPANPDGSPVAEDGTSYHFSSFVPGENLLTGYVWSPPESSDAGRLVSLLESLRKFAEAPPENGPANQADLRKAAAAIARPVE
jgi:hypothetical protein